MQVYMLILSYDYEGSSVLSLHRTLEGARAAAAKYRTSWESDWWREENPGLLWRGGFSTSLHIESADVQE